MPWYLIKSELSRRGDLCKKKALERGQSVNFSKRKWRAKIFQCLPSPPFPAPPHSPFPFIPIPLILSLLHCHYIQIILICILSIFHFFPLWEDSQAPSCFLILGIFSRQNLPGSMTSKAISGVCKNLKSLEEDVSGVGIGRIEPREGQPGNLLIIDYLLSVCFKSSFPSTLHVLLMQ